MGSRNSLCRNSSSILTVVIILEFHEFKNNTVGTLAAVQQTLCHLAENTDLNPYVSLGNWEQKSPKLFSMMSCAKPLYDFS